MKWTSLALKAAVVAAALTSWTTTASAAACTNDIDCDAGGTACGTDVCSWANLANHVCVAATSDPGWCTVDSDCKCMGIGAKCVSPYCTITLPDGGVGKAGGGSSSSSASGSVSASGSATASSSATGTESSSSESSHESGGSSSGGCSMGVGTTSPWWAAGLGLVCLARVRRRRR